MSEYLLKLHSQSLLHFHKFPYGFGSGSGFYGRVPNNVSAKQIISTSSSWQNSRFNFLFLPQIDLESVTKRKMDLCIGNLPSSVYASPWEPRLDSSLGDDKRPSSYALDDPSGQGGINANMNQEWMHMFGGTTQKAADIVPDDLNKDLSKYANKSRYSTVLHSNSLVTFIHLIL
jgi:hypothetical protein